MDPHEEAKHRPVNPPPTTETSERPSKESLEKSQKRKQRTQYHQARAQNIVNNQNSANNELVLRHKNDNQADQESAGSSDTNSSEEEIESPRPGNGASSSDTRSQRRSRYSSLPSADELSRMERVMALQERAAKIRPQEGNHYMKITVRGDARVIEGNVFGADDFEAQALARNHKYHDTDADAQGSVIVGNLTFGGMERFFGGRKNTQHYGESAARRKTKKR